MGFSVVLDPFGVNYASKALEIHTAALIKYKVGLWLSSGSIMSV